MNKSDTELLRPVYITKQLVDNWKNNQTHSVKSMSVEDDIHRHFFISLFYKYEPWMRTPHDVLRLFLTTVQDPQSLTIEGPPPPKGRNRLVLPP